MGPSPSSRRRTPPLIASALAFAAIAVPTVAAQEPSASEPPQPSPSTTPSEEPAPQTDDGAQPESAPGGDAVSGQEAAAIFSQEFDDELALLDADPANVLAGSDLIRFRSDNVAVVDPPGSGSRELLVSSIPLRTEGGEPLDLSLEAAPQGVVPEASNSEVELPTDLGEPARLPEAGVSLSFADIAAEPAEARLIEGREIAFYPNVGAGSDTDVAIAPTSGGLESFAQLRGPDSQVPSIEVGMPDSATLEEHPSGGAQVTDASGNPLVLVSPPRAVDADGRAVPAEMAVVGDRLVFSLDTSDPSISWPVLIDPTFDYNWYFQSFTYGLSAWNAYGDTADFSAVKYCFTAASMSCWFMNWSGAEHYVGEPYCGCPDATYARGLFIYQKNGYAYQAGDQVEWKLQAPGTTSWISSLWANPIRWERGPNPAIANPKAYIQVENNSGTAVGTSRRNFTTAASEYDATYSWTAPTSPADHTGRLAIVGMESSANQISSGAWRYLRVARFVIGFEDPEPPSVPPPAVSGVPASGWVGDTTLSATAQASDPGLGVSSLKLQVPRQGGGEDLQSYAVLDQLGSGYPCTGDKTRPCPVSPTLASNTFSFQTDNMPEGINAVTVEAVDPTTKTASNTVEVKVDRSYPTGGGSLAGGDLFSSSSMDAPDQAAVIVNGTDGGSGLTSVKLIADPETSNEITLLDLDSSAVSAGQTCNAGSCSFHYELTADISALSYGSHIAKLKVVDANGHATSVSSEFGRDQGSPTLTIDPASIPAGWITGAEAVTLSAIAQDTGAGIQRVTQTDPRSGGGTVTVSPEPYSSACAGTAASPCEQNPLAVSASVSVSDLPEGENAVKLKAIDALGKSFEQTAAVKVDRSSPVIDVSGQLAEATDETGTAEQPEPDGQAEELALPIYRLHVDASDGSAASPRSGLETLEVKLDSEENVVHSEEQDCAGGSCPASDSFDWDLNPLELSPGPHKAIVTATDQVGHSRTRVIEFEYRPATGILEDYVMLYAPLPDGSEFAVNAINGNLVYRTNDVEVEGEDVDLSVDRYYNSQLPEGEGELGNGWTSDAAPDVAPTELEPPAGAPPSAAETKLEGPSGYTEGFDAVEDPGDSEFSEQLQATLEETASGAYELSYEGSTDTMLFDGEGKLNQVETINDATVDYAYVGDELSEIETSEGASAGVAYDDGQISQIAVVDAETLTYAHNEDGDLTGYSAASGGVTSDTTTYSYDGSDRLIRLTAADGTVAELTYDGLGRATEITLTLPDSTTKTTAFSYADRQTTVTAPDSTITTYTFGNGGSVLRSSSGAPPTINLSGAVWDQRGQALPHGIYELQIATASSDQIDAAEVWVDGDSLMEEWECSEQCGSFSPVWNLETETYAAGTADVEVFVYTQSGGVASERLAVDLPGLPEPPEAEPVEATIAVAQELREELGLPSDTAYVQDTLSDTNLDHSERYYGIPMTDEELASLQHRETVTEDLDLVDQFVAQHGLEDVFAGVYVDEDIHGSVLVRAGFTEDSQAHLASLANAVWFGADIRPFESAPTMTEAELATLHQRVVNDTVILAQAGVDSRYVATSDRENRIYLGVPHVTTPIEATLEQRYGADVVAQESGPLTPLGASVRAGMKAFRNGEDDVGPHCTTGPSGYDEYTVRVSQTRTKLKRSWWTLIAEHCGDPGEWFRVGAPGSHKKGTLWRDRGPEGSPDNVIIGGDLGIDAAGLRYPRKVVAPLVQTPWGVTRRVGFTGTVTEKNVRAGTIYCLSGSWSGKYDDLEHCGEALDSDVTNTTQNWGQQAEFSINACIGDSGGPIYKNLPNNRVKIVAIASAFSPNGAPYEKDGRSCATAVLGQRIGAAQQATGITVLKAGDFAD